MTEHGPRVLHAQYIQDHQLVHIVRYEKSGKWWVESPTSAVMVTINEAVQAALEHDAEILFGQPGGRTFDARCRP